ncbi:hypothetical protein SKAU_G00306810 [Synaphobranchus kaupii]|uniref:Uncharacterized protein n=1 Tax=Synaphobranchus kaupii TaxID=118154 RepID=A0A9Q1EQZ2_SYNKA|nr:hypothetical protein SKAU_G00306810 [Synaphobranchus kaupii]
MRKSVYHRGELWEVYQKINIRDAISLIDQGGNVLSSARLSLPSMASRTSLSEVTNVTNYLRGNESGVCLDLQVIDMVPSGKVQEETETHHLLTGNLYKPRRRYQAHYSRHFMTVGDKERQDREVFQRNMRGRLESFKSTRHKGKGRHKKDRSQKKRKGSDVKEQDVNGKPRRNVSWQDTDSEEEKSETSDPEKEEDVGITFVARKAEEISKEGPKSATPLQEVCQSPSVVPPSPTCAEKHLPWKGGGGTLPVCVSMATTKIVPIDLQQAWNQSISSLESLASPSRAGRAAAPRASPRYAGRRGCGREGEELPRTAPASSSRVAGGGRRGAAAGGGGGGGEEEDAQSLQQQEAQPLMGSGRPPPQPPPASQGAGGRRPPRV